MKELSLNILDIAQNSIKARATLVSIIIDETDETLKFSIIDDGCGMKKDFLTHVTDPFTTSRTTRSVGLGLPFLKMEAEMTGGTFAIESRHESEYADHGTTVTASFDKRSIDYIPLGDIIGTVCTLIQGTDDGIDYRFVHIMPDKTVELDTRQMRGILGDEVSLNDPEVMAWIRDYLQEGYNA